MILAMIVAVVTATWTLTLEPSAAHANEFQCSKGYEWGYIAVMEVWMVYEGGIPSRQFHIENYSDNAAVCEQFIRMLNSTPGVPVHFCKPATYTTCIPTAETAQRFKEFLNK
jgi:hypothetical protein